MGKTVSSIALECISSLQELCYLLLNWVRTLPAHRQKQKGEHVLKTALTSFYFPVQWQGNISCIK